MSRAVVLFTRDLRIRDQRALSEAVREAEEIVPLFVLEHGLLAGSCGSPNRLAHLLDCLTDLDRSLRERGGRLLIRRGEVVAEALAAARRWNAGVIHMSADHTPYAQARHERLLWACREAGVALHRHPGMCAVEPGALTPLGGGDHYRVFTPYWRVWRAKVGHAPARAPARIAVPEDLPEASIPALRGLARGRGGASPDLARGGETGARKRLEQWIRSARPGGLQRYPALHDDLPAAETSHLSGALHLGCLSPGSVLARARGRTGAEDFARQLCWRDFHHQVLAARPDIPHADYRPRGDSWRDDPDAADAWRRGLTGYPIVDAGMRQLADEGFMHNRARLIVASFLTKTLYLDWRVGAAHFARLLIDADVANNVGNWQWVAGTGNDTRPNRVLNPLRQAERFDPRGDYVRRHLPELAGIEGAAVHRPWLLPERLRRGLGYPAPILAPGAEPALRSGRGRARAGPRPGPETAS